MKSDDNIVMNNPLQSRQPRVRERKQSSGNWNPDWEPFAKLDPAWTEKVIAMAISPRVAGVLDPKTIELIGIALDVCARTPRRGSAGTSALKAGATEEITACCNSQSARSHSASAVRSCSRNSTRATRQEKRSSSSSQPN
jgi:hypothetical protein